ncbi:MAG: nucleoside monophosphate kinase [Anaerolineaceae bacterium]|nr:MAG: nucleoside monophosphate kinase [Anaerolineaceae bacterium]
MGLYVIIMGVQGAGKGTQAAYIQAQYGIPQVSTGDLFRAMKTREDELARRVQDIMNAGLLVPDEVTNEVLQDRLEQADAAGGVILDGYPRNIAQAEWLAQYLTGRGESLSAVILLELDAFTAFKRAFGRVQSPSSGQMFNIYSEAERLTWQAVPHPGGEYPPRIEATDTQTGEALARRSDDADAASVVKRIDTFYAATQPLVDYYRERGVLVSVNADQPVEAVSAAIKSELDRIQSGG